jgi:hypothetical protein
MSGAHSANRGRNSPGANDISTSRCESGCKNNLRMFAYSFQANMNYFTINLFLFLFDDSMPYLLDSMSSFIIGTTFKIAEPPRLGSPLFPSFAPVIGIVLAKNRIPLEHFRAAPSASYFHITQFCKKDACEDAGSNEGHQKYRRTGVSTRHGEHVLSSQRDKNGGGVLLSIV